MDELFTRNQLATHYKIKPETVRRIIRTITPDGRIARYPAYTIKTFEKAKADYYKNAVEEIDSEEDEAERRRAQDGEVDELTAAAKLRYELAKAEKAELDNLERKHIQVSRIQVEAFIRFLSQLYANSLKEVTRGKGDEYYNTVVEEIYKDIEAYVTEEDIGHVVQEETLEAVQDDLLTGMDKKNDQYTI
jgi:signal recognition particle GTPase